jgi:hypothetical protein
MRIFLRDYCCLGSQFRLEQKAFIKLGLPLALLEDAANAFPHFMLFALSFLLREILVGLLRIIEDLRKEALIPFLLENSRPLIVSRSFGCSRRFGLQGAPGERGSSRQVG